MFDGFLPCLCYVAAHRVNETICVAEGGCRRVAVDFLIGVIRDETNLVDLAERFAVLRRDNAWLYQVQTKSGDEAAVGLDALGLDGRVGGLQCGAGRVEHSVVGAIARAAKIAGVE